MNIPDFKLHRVYDRRTDLHAVFGGPRQSGISPCQGDPVLFIFASPAGAQHGYIDEVDSNGVLSYTGEGQIGDMTLTRGNRAIRDHAAEGRAIYFFRSMGKSKGYRFEGEFTYASHSWGRGPDREGNDRATIVFELVPVGIPTASVAQPALSDELEPSAGQDLAALRAKALEALKPGQEGLRGSLAARSVYERSMQVAAYVLARADGVCESCSGPAPFKRKKGGAPYLEVHHIVRVSDGGLDHPKNIGAICPSCHREIHYGQSGDQRNSELADRVMVLEEGRPSTTTM